MKRGHLKNKIINYFSKLEKDVWKKKVDLFKHFEEFSPETVGRCLRDLAEDKTIAVDYYDSLYSKKLAMYANSATIVSNKVGTKPITRKVTIEIRDGKPVAVITE